MTVRLTPERKNELQAYCKALLNKSKCTIRKFAKLIGLMVASERGVEHAPLFYKPLEKIKEFQLQINKGNFDWFMKITSKCKDTMQWWKEACYANSTFYRNTQISLFVELVGCGLPLIYF